MINKYLKNIPLPIRLFLGKALLFFIVWKLIYGLFLVDSLFLDNALTSHVGKASAYVLNNLTGLSGFSSIIEISDEKFNGEVITNQISSIFHNDKKVLYIANVCNGLELIVLYIGFIVCMPSNILRKVKYIIIGIIILDLVNILRCVGLIYLREYFEIYFQFAHHYLFKMIVYLTTFFMWVYYTRKIEIKNESL